LLFTAQLRGDYSMIVKGPWNICQVRDFLDEAKIPLRIACQGSSGHPIIASLWCLREGDRLWCATQEDSSLAKLIGRDNKCAFEVSLESPPYRGVRGPGLASLHPERGAEILRALIERYHGRTDSRFAGLLLDRAETEVAVQIEPQNFLTWDFDKRMKDPG
jgi:hypothetical protein